MAPKPTEAAQAAPESEVAPAAAPVPAMPAGIDPNVLALAQALLQGQREINAETVKAQADAYAASMKVAMKPENADPPLISDFNPMGDRDHPRPELKCPFTMNGAELPKELLTVEEIVLLNQLEPDHYRITKTDDTQVIVSVVAEHDSASGLLTKMNLVSKFGNKRNPQDKDNWPPMRVWLAEMIGVPAPERARPRLPVGRVARPQMGAPSGLNGVISAMGTLANNKQWLGPIEGEVNAMLARETDAIPA